MSWPPCEYKDAGRGVVCAYGDLARDLDVLQQVGAREPHHVPGVFETAELVANLLAVPLRLAEARWGGSLFDRHCNASGEEYTSVT